MARPQTLVHADRFRERVVIVTGGSAGIGRAIVEQLGKEGARLALTSLPEDAGVTVPELEKQGYKAIEFAGDMSGETFCRDVVRGTLAEYGRVDHLVNNAFSFNAEGIGATGADWERIMFVGPVAFARMIQLVAEPMKRVGGGSIVNISSISAHIAQPERWTYNTAKGAVNQLTRCCAMDLASHGIRINTISPGWTWTREVAKAAGGDRSKWEPIWGQYALLERICEPIEVARPTLFLLSDDASFITGTELFVDGGYNAMGPEGLGKSSTFAGTD